MTQLSHPTPLTTSQPNAPAHLTIKIRDTHKNETYLKLKPTTRFHKLYTTYAENKGLEPGSFRLLFDGTLLLRDQVAGDVGLEDGDMLEIGLMRESSRRACCAVVNVPSWASEPAGLLSR